MTAKNHRSSSARVGEETLTVPVSLPSSIISCGVATKSNDKAVQKNASNILLGWCASSHHLNLISKTAASNKNATVSSYICRPGSSLKSVTVDATSNLVWTLQSDGVLTSWHHNQQNANELSGPNDETKSHLLHSCTLDQKRYGPWQSPFTTTVTVDAVKIPFWINFANHQSISKKSKKSQKNGFELLVVTPANQQTQHLSLKEKHKSRDLIVETVPFYFPGFQSFHDKILNSWITVSEEPNSTTTPNQRKRKITKRESHQMKIQLDLIVLKKGNALQYYCATFSCPYSKIDTKIDGQNNIWLRENILVKNIQPFFDPNDYSKDHKLSDLLRVAKWRHKNCFAFVYQLPNNKTDSNNNSPDTFQCNLMNSPPPTQKKLPTGEKQHLKTEKHLTLTKPSSSCQLQDLQTLSDGMMVVHWFENDKGQSIVDLYHTKKCLMLSRNHYNSDSKVAFCKTNHTISMAIMDSANAIFTDLFTNSSTKKLSLAQSLAKINVPLFQAQLPKENNLNHLLQDTYPSVTSKKNLEQQKIAIEELQKYRDIHTSKEFDFWETFTKSMEELMKNGKKGKKDRAALAKAARTNGRAKKKSKTSSSDQVIDRVACEDMPNVFFETALSIAMDAILLCEMECRQSKKKREVEELFRIQQACASRVLIECLRLKDLSARVHVMVELSHRHHFNKNGPLLALLLSLRNLRNFKWSKTTQNHHDNAQTPLQIIRSMILYCPNLTEHMIVVMIRYIVCYSDEVELIEDMAKQTSWYEQYSETFHAPLISKATNNDEGLMSDSSSKVLSRCKLFWTFAILCLRQKETSAPNPALLRSAFLQQRMCKREVMTWLQLLSNILKRAVTAASVTLKYPGSTKQVIHLISALMDSHIGLLLESSLLQNDDDDDDDERSESTEIEMKKLKKEVKASILVAKAQAEVVLELKTLLQTVQVHLSDDTESKITGSCPAQSFSKKDDLNYNNMSGLSMDSRDNKLLSNDPIPMYSLERLVF